MINYDWKLKTGYPNKKHGKKVFSTFACGGGSTMGYKLAGFDVIGANDIDPEMATVYKLNHNPKHYYLAPIGDLITADLHQDLFDLDILDGSPPCSTFSLSGLRESAWDVKKKFREGQADQVLSDLFFEFIALANRLRPKIVVSENVKGMIMGNAKEYTRRVVEQFSSIGYDTQLFLLNGAQMGLPQRRERVFFISRRKDLNLPKIKLDFNFSPVPFADIDEGDVKGYDVTEISTIRELWEKCQPGKSLSSVHEKGSFFNYYKVNTAHVVCTLTAGSSKGILHHTYPRYLTHSELSKIGSFPTDYNFGKTDPGYLIGMSVPPLMMARVADEVYKQLLKD
jgi:DNA (cytosine-5)-methyltransferase 1